MVQPEPAVRGQGPMPRPDANAEPSAVLRPKGPWVCFHCGFIAHTPEQAREHFGPDRWEAAACQALTAQRERIERIIGDRGISARVMFLLECLVRNVPDAHPNYADALVQKVAEAFANLNTGPWQTFAKEAEACIAVVRAHSKRPAIEADEASTEAALWREHDARALAQQAEASPQPSEARGRTDASLTPGTNQSNLKEERS